MQGTRHKILPFPAVRGDGVGEGPRVGRVHSDGSITYRGRTYATIKDLPADWVALRPDVETWKQWIRLYRAIDPRGRRGGGVGKPI